VSQYPQPYYQQPYGQPPVDYSQYVSPGDADLLGPARRASILQGILGGLMILCSVGVGAVPWIGSPGDMIESSGMQVPQLPPGWTLDQFVRLVYGILAGCGSIVGISLLVLCVFVRRGGAAPAITSIVLEGLVVLILVLNVISGIIQALGNPVLGIAVVLLAVPLSLFLLNITWLVGAVRNAGRIAFARQQYQAQFYMHQQQQQAYGQPAYGMPAAPPPPGYGYGYGYAPPPPPSFGPAGQAQSQAQQPPQPASPPGPTPTPPPPTGDADGPTPPPPAAG
jgi:hypothetical protein